MYETLPAMPSRELARLCAVALVMLMPGSFLVLPLLWLGRRFARRAVHRHPQLLS
jgi:hypothetical protein